MRFALTQRCRCKHNLSYHWNLRRFSFLGPNLWVLMQQKKALETLKGLELPKTSDSNKFQGLQRRLSQLYYVISRKVKIPGEDETHLVDCRLLRVARIFLPIYWRKIRHDHRQNLFGFLSQFRRNFEGRSLIPGFNRTRRLQHFSLSTDGQLFTAHVAWFINEGMH